MSGTQAQERVAALRQDLPVAAGFAHGGLAGMIDSIEVSPLPVVRVFGWHLGRERLPLVLETSQGRTVQSASFARTRRADVQAVHAGSDLFSGFRADFMLDAGEPPQRLLLDGQLLQQWHQPARSHSMDVHYAGLFTETRVLQRDEIYGYGPPTDVSLEFKQFTARASGKVLDFGCGNGDVVRHLLESGCDAIGLELDEPRIRDALAPEAAAYVQLYDGSIPLPFADGSFDCIVTTEVIEHVPDIARYVGELQRVLKPGGRLLLTTPDISSIPSSFPTNTVPWHLLESTHINFFTPHSVEALFAPGFEMEELFGLGGGRVNGFFVPGSIGAVLRRRDLAG